MGLQIRSVTRQLALLSLAVIACVTQAQADQEFDRSWPAIVDSIVEVEGLGRGVPGLAVAVVADGQIVMQRGYGSADVTTGRAVTTATPFSNASVTKPFTSAVVLQLVAEGRVGLDDRVRRHVAWLPERYRDITIRQLLTHTSGIARDLRLDNFDDPDVATYRQRLDTARASAAPGVRFEYSNTGYTVLGWLIEDIEKESLAAVLQRRVFDPLGMQQARYRASLEEDVLRARPHTVTDGRPQSMDYITGGFGSGGMSMSAADAAAFGLALQQERFFPNSLSDTAWSPARLASGEALDLLMFGQPASYGFGWFLTEYSGHAMMTHGGGIEGYTANLYHFPAQRLTIVVLANTKARDDGVAPVDPIARRIADTCLAQDGCRFGSELAQLRREIVAANRAFSNAYLMGDTAAIAQMYTADAVALPPNARVVTGAGSVSRLFQAPRSNRRVYHALYTEQLIRYGSTVVEFGTWFDRWQPDSVEGTQESAGRYTLTWVRDGTAWKIASDSWVPSATR